MADKQSRFSLDAVVAAILQSDSESDFSDTDNSSDFECEEVKQDSNEDCSSGTEEKSDADSETGFNCGPQPVRRKMVRSNLPQVIAAQVLTGKNGRIWSQTAKPLAQTAAENVLTQKHGLTAIGQRSENLPDSFALFMTERMIFLIVRETNH
ncbi:hypothetical protein HELRODRAFT_181295 [Helobdella robusta]|uniref:Uncharacterized protein n=1 Tax=Helobdella robusta TaxID=6412 RepID=T1FGV2_HELRO|nr:hypothetical protein HELRODRAFT_181295 [Helobdella robusta]ESN93182.1 hypothetical protein HELRODRAFT_181295 [Helobdella robusta]